MDDSAIICNEIVESYDEETNFYKKKVTCKTHNFSNLLNIIDSC